MSDVVLIVCVTTLIILFVGDPDLMDGIIKWVHNR